jgi:hypothetical protein
MRFVTRSLVVIMSLIGTAHADGDSLVDSLGPREVAVGEALRGSATGATAIGMNPAGLSLNRELVFEGGYGYRLSDSASLVGVSACDSTSAMPGCFYYKYTTTDMQHTHVAGSSLAYPVTPRVSLGSSVKYFNFSPDVMGGPPKTSGFTFDAGTTLRITDLVNLGIAGYNLFGKDSPEFQRAVGGGVLARPIPALAISFDARWKLESDDRSARYGGGAELFLRSGNGQTGFPLRVGALRDNGLSSTFLSAGVGMASMKFAIDIAGRLAVSGADETMFIASMRFFGPRLAGPSLDVAE